MSGSPGLWVVSDDERLSEQARAAVARTGITLRILDALPDDLESSGETSPDWILYDLDARQADPDRLADLKTSRPACQLFLLAGDARAPVPSSLARLGVRHWFLRPVDPAELRRVLRAALRSRRAEEERLRRRDREIPAFGDLIGGADAFRQVCGLAERAAESASTVVLIEGETGTGKSLMARAIHGASPRARGPFVEVNCPSLPGTLLESELFGHERGSFTHAQAAKPGLLELADSGSFFLDEVGETDPAVQAKLLKFLDSGRYRRVGGIEEREVDVRVLAATQTDLSAQVREGRFRVDLFHRLHVVRVRIPALRERPGDIRLLLTHYLREFSTRAGKPGLQWDRSALEILERYAWPGNVREIVNLCERMALLSASAGRLGAADLPAGFAPHPVAQGTRKEGKLTLNLPAGVTFEEVERATIEWALERSKGNVSLAAGALGIGRGQLRYRMERLGFLSDSPRRARSRSMRLARARADCREAA